MYSVFMITSFFGFFAYIWLFLVVSVISPDVIDLWEAIITLLMFPLVVLLAFAAEKGFFLKRQPDMEEEEEKMLESSLDNMKFEDYKSDLLSFLKEIGQTSTLTLKDKAELFAAKLSEKAPRSRSQYFMQGTRMFTGGKSLFMKPADKILELSKGMNTRSSLADIQNADYTDVRQLAASIRTQDAQGHSIIEFSSTSYAVLESQQYVELIINRHGLTNIASRFRLDTIDGTATEGEDYIKLAEEFEMQPGETD
ncbi:unnamed protein product [Didymodactylos carnosus]|uniref:Calx-beta domain-containing protein n=1 Tax=Didymodactylos carnosus TaxID=1234261 RepID=A0A8S2FTH0_9BILA|nr:unnamed protein product [Didymodactylos carnosus]CAF4349321.1 unnamed protein product [Didymodactylos carnosus]